MKKKTAKKLFKTYGDASKYCNDNGFDIPGNIDPWELADKIIIIRADQHKITCNTCVENINNLERLNDLLEHKPYIKLVEAVSTIWNTETTQSNC